MQSRKIGVLLGGLSSEREVSLRTGEAVLAALRDRGHDVVPIYVDRDVDVALRQEQIDVAFIALHGRWGEDGCIQGLLELLGIPYTGSDVLASALAMHKGKAKELFRLHNLPTPAYYTLTAADTVDLADGPRRLRLPVRGQADPRGQLGRRHDLPLARPSSRPRSSARCASTTRSSSSGSSPARRSRSRSSTTARSAPSRSRRATGSTTTQNKYTRGATDYFVPPRLSPERYRGVLAQALRAHIALGCSGATRVDMMVSDSGNEFVLEVNTVPGLTPTSLLPKIADAAGISFGELCELMLAGAALAIAARPRRAPDPPARRSSATIAARAAPEHALMTH